MEKLFYGLDFGTSNCSIALMREGDVEVIPLEEDGGGVMPTLLYFHPGRREYHVGNEAVRHYLGNGMRGRFMQSMKSFLPDASFLGTRIERFGTLTIEDLAGFVLRSVRERANRATGLTVDTVVLGKPARFSSDPEEERLATERLVRAAKKAGFTEIYLQPEPIAAAFAYEATLTRDELVLVADFGGGTTDFSIAALSPSRRGTGNRWDDIRAAGGVSIGGDRFDSDIMKRKLLRHFGEGTTYRFRDSASPQSTNIEIPRTLLNELSCWQKHALLKSRKNQLQLQSLMETANDRNAIARMYALIEKNLGYLLMQSIESAKQELSEKKGAFILFDKDIIRIREPIARDEFEELIAYAIGAYDRAIDGLLTTQGLTASDIDSVFMTGGTSLIPSIRSLLERKFGKEKLRTHETFTSVASGLARSSYLIRT